MPGSERLVPDGERETLPQGLPSSTEPELAYKKEVWRKLLHLFALTVPIGYHFVSTTTAVIACFSAFVASLIVDLARIRGWSIQHLWCRWTDPIVRPRERFKFSGATNILASAWMCPLLFSLPAAAMGMGAIILGDTAAALIGRRWGRHRIAAGRTLEGSAGFLAAAIVASLFVPNLPINIGLMAAALATVVEAASRGIDDNLSVPLIVGLFTDIALRVV